MHEKKLTPEKSGISSILKFNCLFKNYENELNDIGNYEFT